MTARNLKALSGLALSVIVVVACAAASLLRQRGPGALDTLWAEDGTVFLQAGLADASPGAWFEGYAGYLHLLPRMLASIAVSLPVESAAMAFSGASALVLGLLMLVVYRAAETHIPGKLERAVLATCLLVSPSAGAEVINATANIHWYLLPAVVWVALWSPVGAGQTLAACSVLFLAAASDPFAILVAPILGWRLIRSWGRTEAVMTAALVTGIALQALVVLTSGGSRPIDPLATSPATLVKWYGFHVLETAVFGMALRDTLVNTLGVAISAALALAVLAYLIAPVARAARREPFVPLALLGLHLAFFFLMVALVGNSPPRYAITPIVLLYGVIAWGLVSEPERNQWRRRVAAVFVAAVSVLDFAPWNARAEGPRWSAELAKAQSACQVGSPVTTRVAIPPRNLPPEDSRGLDGYWTVTIPCENRPRLSGSR